jgi:hypothetical protein
LWRWGHQRDVTASGASDEPRWPSEAELAPPDALGEGERERTAREARYLLELTAIGTGHVHRIAPASLAELTHARRHPRWYLASDASGTRLLKPMTAPSLARVDLSAR